MQAPRFVDDLITCGEFPATQMFGAHDGLSRQRPYHVEVFHDRTEELSQLIRDAKSSTPRREDRQDSEDDEGKLVYLDFDEGLREIMRAAERGERG